MPPHHETLEGTFNVVTDVEPEVVEAHVPKSRLGILQSASKVGVDLRDFMSRGVEERLPVAVLETEIESGAEPLALDVPVTPERYLAAAIVDLPEVELVVVSEPEPLPELGLAAHPATMTPESVYSTLVGMLALHNPDEARLIEGLRLYESQYVGVITTVEQAVDHINKCREHNEPIDRNIPDKGDPDLKHKMYIERRFKHYKLKKIVVEEKRAAWKKAIEDKKAAIAGWDAYVKTMHDEFNRVKDLPAEYFTEVVES